MSVLSLNVQRLLVGGIIAQLRHLRLVPWHVLRADASSRLVISPLAWRHLVFRFPWRAIHLDVLRPLHRRTNLVSLLERLHVFLGDLVPLLVMHVGHPTEPLWANHGAIILVLDGPYPTGVVWPNPRGRRVFNPARATVWHIGVLKILVAIRVRAHLVAHSEHTLHAQLAVGTPRPLRTGCICPLLPKPRGWVAGWVKCLRRLL
mmetsp:Transcript_60891/g.135671  ORF Transcript_60891/g.135671 Transcript_60891/m.135671 type:complete len:204 (-) Transcript_60891:84-695(-)